LTNRLPHGEADDAYRPPPIRWHGLRIIVTPGGISYRCCWRCGQWDRDGVISSKPDELIAARHTPACRRRTVEATKES